MGDTVNGGDMNCAECQQELADYVLGLVNPTDRRRLEAHLEARCPDCEQQLDALRAATVLLTEPLEPLAPPPELKELLFAKLIGDASRLGANFGQNAPSERREEYFPAAEGALTVGSRGESIAFWRRALPYVAATLCAFAAGIAFHGSAPETDRATPAEAELYRARMAEIARSFDTAGIQLVELGSMVSDPQLRGGVVWDASARQFHVFLFDLVPPPAGRHYQMWIASRGDQENGDQENGDHENGDQWIGRGRLDPDPTGAAHALVDVAPAAGPSIKLLVTSESGDDTPAQAPQGPTVLAAELATP